MISGEYITQLNLIEETEKVLTSLRQVIIEDPEKGLNLVMALNEVSNKISKGRNSVTEEDKKIVEKMVEKLDPYVPKESKITEYRKLGKMLSEDSKICLSEYNMRQVPLMKWFDYHWDNLQQYLEKYRRF